MVYLFRYYYMEQLKNKNEENIVKAIELRLQRKFDKLTLQEHIFVINQLYDANLCEENFNFEIPFLMRKDQFLTQLFERIDDYCKENELNAKNLKQLIPVFWKQQTSDIYGYFNDLRSQGIIV